MKKLIVLLVLPLHGCLFFYIPSGAFQAGNACARENVAVGDTLPHTDGRSGKVEQIIGRHQRCQNAQFPILVDAAFEEGKRNVQVWEQK